MKRSIFWDIPPCSPLKANLCFIGLYAVISQETEHLITTTARTSEATQPSNDYFLILILLNASMKQKALKNIHTLDIQLKQDLLIIFIIQQQVVCAHHSSRQIAKVQQRLQIYSKLCVSLYGADYFQVVLRLPTSMKKMLYRHKNILEREKFTEFAKI